MKAKVVNCRKMGLRKDPTDTQYFEETIEEVDAGTVLNVISSDVIYDWTGKAFYKVDMENGKVGYANVDCLLLL